MDRSLLDEMKKVLDTPDKDVDLSGAAVLLIKFSRNRILHENIIRRKNVAKLKYELQKYYDFHTKENAAEETKILEKKAVTVVKETFPAIEKKEAEELKGKRPDHDGLPDEIKAKYLENQNLFPRMRKLHEQLKLMADKRACDRYPYLKELAEADKKLRENWDEYDAYVIVPENPNPEGGEQPSAVVPDAKKISAARKYLSDNKAKLKDLHNSEDLEIQAQYLNLLHKMQDRLNLLIPANAGISDEQLSEQKALGLTNAQ